MSKESIVSNLIAGIEFDDPRLHDLLEYLVSDVYKTYNNVFPPSIISIGGYTGQIIGPSQVQNFAYILYNDNLHLSWNQVNPLFSYEIRYVLGSKDATAWDTASVVLTTNTIQADINPKLIPLTTSNNHTFLIKAVDTNGTYSIFPSYVVVFIPQIPNPIITATPIQNTVLISWSIPTSTWSIASYKLYRNNVYLTQLTGTFYTITELVSGTYQYAVEAIDIVGNISVRSGNVSVTVTNPVDFALLDQRPPLDPYPTIDPPNGSLRPGLDDIRAGFPQYSPMVDPNYTRILVAVRNEGYQQHFQTDSWNSPQDQINAGFPYFSERGFSGAYSYRWDFDFGIIVNNVSLSIKYTLKTVIGNLDISNSGLAYSTDNSSWSAITAGTTVFAPSARYARFYLRGNGTSTDLSYIYNIYCLLSLTKITDSGNFTAFAADTNGTVVTLNENFTSVTAIELTPQTTVAVFPVLNFAGGYYPTSFRVLVFDNAGVRINCPVHWMARGLR